jgi:hypothetical protein
MFQMGWVIYLPDIFDNGRSGLYPDILPIQEYLKQLHFNEQQ